MRFIKIRKVEYPLNDYKFVWTLAIHIPVRGGEKYYQLKLVPYMWWLKIKIVKQKIFGVKRK